MTDNDPHRSRDLSARASSVPESSGRYEIEFSEEPSNPEWDEFVERVPGGSHVQTTSWGRLKTGDGWTPVRLLVREGDEIVAGAQILTRKVSGRGAIGYVPKAPLFFSNDRELTQATLRGLGQVVERYRVQHLTVQPSKEGDRVVPLLEEAGYRESPIAVAPLATVQIDLRPELDAILGDMRKNHRRYVRHGLRQGMVPRVGEESDLEQFHELLEATSRRQGFSPYPIEHFAQLWRLFHPTGQVQLFLVEYEGELVSGQLAVAFRDRVVAKNSGWTGEHGSLGPNYVMDWATLKWAKEHGYRYYDLEGIDVDAARAVRRGESVPEYVRKTASFYKLGFGGEVVLFPSPYVLIPNRPLRWLYWSVFSKLSKMRIVERAVGRLRTRSRSKRA